MNIRKNIYALSLFVFFGSHSLSAGESSFRVLESSPQQIVIGVELAPVTIEKMEIEAGHFHGISMDGFDLSSRPGQPALPVKGITVALPANGEVSLSVSGELSTSFTEISVIPAAERFAEKTDKYGAEFRPDEKFYSQNNWSPEKPAQIGYIGCIRDQRVAQIQINPVRYNPALKELRCYKTITLRLTISGGAETPSLTGSAVSPDMEDVLQKLVLNYDDGKKWRMNAARDASLKKQVNWYANQSWHKIYIKEDGVYRIDERDLRRAGISLSGIDPSRIKIYYKGVEQPVYVKGEKDGKFNRDDYIQFYARHNREENQYFSPYSISNVYWLTFDGGSGLRAPEIDGGLYLKDSTRYNQPVCTVITEHYESDLRFDRLILVPDESQDHWFWDILEVNTPYEINFDLHQPIDNGVPAVFNIKFFGLTHTVENPDHHAVIKLNGHWLGEVLWDGQTESGIECEFSHDVLRDGENILTIDLPGDTPAGEIDQVYLNWFEISYSRELYAVNDYAEVNVEASGISQQIEIRGFNTEDIYVLDNTGRRVVNLAVVADGDKKKIKFQTIPGFAPVTYYAFTNNSLKRPEKIMTDSYSTLSSGSNGADYLIITHELFRNAAEILGEHRSTTGLRTKVVDIQDVYDEFSHGVYDPRAIQKFLDFAYHNWQSPAPLYVLILGDTHYGFDKLDPRNWNEISYVPTMMKYTSSWGATSSDNALVCVSGDDRLPDMFVGRLPANSREEADIMVQKIIQYEKQPLLEDWRKKVCLSCGSDYFFEKSAQHLYDEYIPKSFDVPRVYTNPQSEYFGSTEELVNVFNDGVTLVNFIGHGGGGVFFDAELFLLDDIVKLTNASRLPVLFSLTCFIGYFDNPWKSSLGEELLWANGGGVVASFGSAGRAWLYGDYLLNNALFESIFTANHENLGQITTESKWKLIAVSNDYWDHVENYNLLGDPAMKIGLPKHEVTMTTQNASLKPGESLVIEGSVPDQNGHVKLSAYQSGDSLFAEKTVTVVNGAFSATMQLPQNAKSGNGLVKAYFWNETTDGAGDFSFGIDSPFFLRFSTDPSQPGHLDSTYVFTEIVSTSEITPNGIDSMSCTWTSNQYTWETIPMIPYEANVYRSKKAISAWEQLKVAFKFMAYYHVDGVNGVKVITSEEFAYYVRKRADLKVTEPGFIINGNQGVNVLFTVINDGGTDAQQVDIDMYDGNPFYDGIKIGATKTEKLIEANSETIINMTWPGDPTGKHKLYIRLDSGNRVSEVNEYNNTFYQEVNLVTIKNGSSEELTSADNQFILSIPSEGISENSSVKIDDVTEHDLKNLYHHPNSFEPVVLNGTRPLCYQIIYNNEAAKVVKNYKVSFIAASLDTQILNQQLGIYAWDTTSEQWIPCETMISVEENKTEAEMTDMRLVFALFKINDRIPPRIDMKVQDQQLISGDYVSAEPIISATIEDESGFNHAAPFRILLDNEDADSLDYTYSIESGMLIITYRPILQPGDHQLKIEAMDLIGNVSESSISFMVSDGFQLLGIANHPNPFNDQTVIAYTLTEEAEDVHIKIYTSSGRMIRSFHYMNETGYIEHVWDGREEFGDEIANGVYYLQFEAKRSGHRVEQVEKMAKLK